LAGSIFHAVIQEGSVDNVFTVRRFTSIVKAFGRTIISTQPLSNPLLCNRNTLFYSSFMTVAVPPRWMLAPTWHRYSLNGATTRLLQNSECLYHSLL
jgi:hypothetical protein